ncbi:hypothetical protein ACOMHN_000944 [Nucella lapillus]
MEMVRYEDKTLYVWIPCAFFLLAIFITLTISFVEHTKRVLKRKRLLREYVEANVLNNRRRICPMFSSSLSPSRYFLQGWESQPSTNHTETCDGSGRYFAAPEIMLTPDLSGGGGQFLTVPSLTSRVSFRGDGANMLETGDPDSWMPQGGLVYGHSNMAFSFDEDLGRTHAKPLRSPNLSRMHPGSSQLSDNGPSYVRAKWFSSHKDRKATLQNFHQSQNSTSGSSGSYSLASEPEGAANDSTFIDNTVQASSTSSGGIFTSSASKYFSPTRTCPHCGSTLPPIPATNTKRAWNLRKNKWKYSRQSACSDFVEMEPGPEAEATVSQFVPDSRSRHSEFSGGPQSNGGPTVYCLPGSSFTTGAQEHWGTNVMYSTIPFYSVASGKKLSYRSGDGEKTSCEDTGRQKSNCGDFGNEKPSWKTPDMEVPKGKNPDMQVLTVTNPVVEALKVENPGVEVLTANILAMGVLTVTRQAAETRRCPELDMCLMRWTCSPFTTYGEKGDKHGSSTISNRNLSPLHHQSPEVTISSQHAGHNGDTNQKLSYR